MHSSRSRALILALLFVASNAFGAQLFYSAVTVDHTKVPSTQTDFAILVSQTDNRFKVTGSGGHVASSSGFDIRPYSDSGLTTPLTYELEKYVSTTGELVMWVKIASLSSASDTVIYLGYGDTTLTTDGSSSSTWDSNYLGVWHLKNGTTLALTDSTSNAYNLTNTATVAATSGKVDGAAGSFNGSSQALNTGDITPASNKITFSAWVNISSFNNGDSIMAEWNINFNSIAGFLVNPNSSGSSQWDLAIHNDAAGGYNGGHFTRPATGVHYFVATFDTTTGTALGAAGYIDGVSQSMTQDNNTNLLGNNFGNHSMYLMSRAASSLFWAATYLDEVRLSKSLRSQDWITTEYNNQNSPSTFETLGTEVNLNPSANSNGFFIFFP